MDTDTLDLLKNRLVIKHAHFQDVQDQVLRAVQYGRSDEALCVFGPTGVGKTTMQNYLVDTLIKKQRNGWKSNFAPPVLVEAPAQVNHKFPWRSLIEEMLELLGEQDLQSKVDLDDIQQNIKSGLDSRSRRNLSEAKIERLLVKRINKLRPICVFIDEGQHMVESLPPLTQMANANIIKHWANRMDTIFIVFGTHEAKGLLNQNEQLSRRVAPIYFPRYKISDPIEYEQYFHFYGNLVQELGLKIDSVVHNDFRYIYNYSLGCPGNLASWLHKSISYCIDKNIDRISKNILQKNRIATDRLRTMEQAIKNFEAYYESTLEEFDPTSVIADDFGQRDMAFSYTSPKSNKTSKNSFKQKPRSHPVHATKLAENSEA